MLVEKWYKSSLIKYDLELKAQMLSVTSSFDYCIDDYFCDTCASDKTLLVWYFILKCMTIGVSILCLCALPDMVSNQLEYRKQAIIFFSSLLFYSCQNISLIFVFLWQRDVLPWTVYVWVGTAIDKSSSEVKNNKKRKQVKLLLSY